MKFQAIIVGLTVLSGALSASAQNYSITWSKIAGGGGTSTGGNYSLIGTIGQHDAGKMTGGNYTLEGGFLSGIVLIQTVGSPQLSIQRSGGTAIISWPVSGSTGFVLQEALELNTLSWGNSGATINTASGTNSVTVPATGVKFYRLRKP
jgi:hypothetical protein